MEMIFAKKFARNDEKNNNTWNIRRLVHKSFVPATQRIILKIVGFLVNSSLAPSSPSTRPQMIFLFHD